MLKQILLAGAIASAATVALAAPMQGPDATTVRRYPTPEARQGVAVDAEHLYAVTNSKIARYNKQTGAKEAEWQGDPARFPHINSCAVLGGELVCANSNFPRIPQWSAVEFFDPATMTHKRTVSLGFGIGSITWIDRKDGAWWVTFANYDGDGGEPLRDHRSTQLVRFDDQWRRTESWAFPKTVLDRFMPMSSSGGGWGPDGKLYVTGHDHRELYALALPKDGGPVLDHLATQAIDVEGQAIDWDESQPGMLYGISRGGGEIVAMRVPPLTAAK